MSGWYPTTILKNRNPVTWDPVIALATAVPYLNNWSSSAGPCTLDEASKLGVASAGPRQVATARRTLQVLVGSFRVGV